MTPEDLQAQIEISAVLVHERGKLADYLLEKMDAWIAEDKAEQELLRNFPNGLRRDATQQE